jgi:uncharacterized membrane protein YtjA (UPF0391 family)
MRRSSLYNLSFIYALLERPSGFGKQAARLFGGGGTTDMLHYALVFLLIALVAALLGFGGIAASFAGIAKILFFLFIILFLVSLIMNVSRRA